jgi:RIO-like serine/threonine protein kinase
MSENRLLKMISISERVGIGGTSYIYRIGNRIYKQYFNKDDNIKEIEFIERIKKEKDYIDLEEYEKTGNINLNIIPYGDVEIHKDFVIIEMALFDGVLGDIYDILDKREKRRIFNELDRTIDILIEMGIYHSDISLENILYKKKNNVYKIVLSDFGRLLDKTNYYEFKENIERELDIYNMMKRYTYGELLKMSKNRRIIKKIYEKELKYLKETIPNRPIEIHKKRIMDYLKRKMIKSMIKK